MPVVAGCFGRGSALGVLAVGLLGCSELGIEGHSDVAGAPLDPSGAWRTPAGVIHLASKDGEVTGTVAFESSPDPEDPEARLETPMTVEIRASAFRFQAGVSAPTPNEVGMKASGVFIDLDHMVGNLTFFTREGRLEQSEFHGVRESPMPLTMYWGTYSGVVTEVPIASDVVHPQVDDGLSARFGPLESTDGLRRGRLQVDYPALFPEGPKEFDLVFDAKTKRFESEGHELQVGKVPFLYYYKAGRPWVMMELTRQ